jgi:hypothetical protein
MHGRARGSCDPPTVVAMFPFLRPVRFSKRTASPALTAAVLAESPLANSVSEREANDQADSNFQHSDSAEAETRTPPDQGGVPGTPMASIEVYEGSASGNTRGAPEVPVPVKEREAG